MNSLKPCCVFSNFQRMRQTHALTLLCTAATGDKKKRETPLHLFLPSPPRNRHTVFPVKKQRKRKENIFIRLSKGRWFPPGDTSRSFFPELCPFPTFLSSLFSLSLSRANSFQVCQSVLLSLSLSLSLCLSLSFSLSRALSSFARVRRYYVRRLRPHLWAAALSFHL